MAEIDIERKSGPPAWLWIVGLLVLGLLIWAVLSMMRRDDDPVTGVFTDTAAVMDTQRVGMAPTGAAAMPAGADAFMRDCHVEQGTRTDDMGREHEFTTNCFEQLASALQGFAQQRGAAQAVEGHVQTIRDRAQRIRQSPPESSEHAGWSSEAASAGADALAAIQQQGYRGDQQLQSAVNDVRQAAQQIQPGTVQLDQMANLRSYFRRMGDALNAMSQRGTA